MTVQSLRRPLGAYTRALEHAGMMVEAIHQVTVDDRRWGRSASTVVSSPMVGMRRPYRLLRHRRPPWTMPRCADVSRGRDATSGPRRRRWLVAPRSEHRGCDGRPGAAAAVPSL